MKNIDIKPLFATTLLTISLLFFTASCSDSEDSASTSKAEATIKCPNADCKYTKPGNPESLSVVDTCPDCGAKLKP